MKEASLAGGKVGPKQQSAAELGIVFVAGVFVQCQQMRHEADYNLSDLLSLEEARLNTLIIREAFKIWGAVRNDSAAQNYLYTLLFKDKF